MKRKMSVFGVLMAAGIAASASASISVSPSNVITWGGTNTGRSLTAVQPSGLTWAWNANAPGQVAIDSNGRVYFQGQYTQTPPVGTIAAANHRGEFTATNSTDLAVFDGIYDGGTKDGLNLRNSTSTTGGTSTTTPRVSGDKVAFGLQFSGGSPAIIESGVGQNNTAFYVGNAGGVSRAAQQGDSITLNDTAGNATVVLNNTALKNISQQNSEINSSGTMIAWMSVPTAAGTGSPLAGQFVSAANAAAAPFGNTAFLATKTVGGGYNVIVQGGQSAPGVAGGRFQNGGNGANGFFAKLNRNGQVAFDGKLTTTFPVTAGSDDVAYIYTPGSGYTLVRREGQAAPDATGSPDAGGALYSGSIGTSSSGSFSNAGLLYTSSLTGGDVVTTAGSANDSGMYLSTTSGTTRVFRRNDQVPGLPANSNFGTVPSGSFHVNNSGRIVTGNILQGSAVISSVNVQTDFFTPGQPVTVAGRMGNDGAIITGPANNLQVIARTGDLIPGTPGLRHVITTNNGSVAMNNNGDVLFQSDSTQYAPGDIIGVVGQPASTLLPAGPTFLWGWTQATGLVAMFYTTQSFEVETGIFKTISQINVLASDNGDGGSGGLNDNGTFVAKLSFTDNTWAVVTAQIPAPGAGMLALLGLGAAARRRRTV